jgi:hypothetical protein
MVNELAQHNREISPNIYMAIVCQGINYPPRSKKAK